MQQSSAWRNTGTASADHVWGVCVGGVYVWGFDGIEITVVVMLCIEDQHSWPRSNVNQQKKYSSDNYENLQVNQLEMKWN